MAAGGLWAGRPAWALRVPALAGLRWGSKQKGGGGQKVTRLDNRTLAELVSLLWHGASHGLGLEYTWLFL